MTAREQVADAAALCAACGICCSGALFERVDLEKGDLTEHGDTVISRPTPRTWALRLPCQFLDGVSCSIYTDRPTRCRDYACTQRRRVLNGETSLRLAQNAVAEVKAMVETLRTIARSMDVGDIDELGTRRWGRQLAKSLEDKLAAGTPITTVERTALEQCFELVALTDRQFEKSERLNSLADLLGRVSDPV